MRTKKNSNGMYECKIYTHDRQSFFYFKVHHHRIPEFKNVELQQRKIRFIGGSNNSRDTLLFRKAQGTKNSFLADLRHKYPAVSIFVLKDIINSSLVPKNIFKLSTKFDSSRMDKKKEKNGKNKQVKGLSNLLQCFLIQYTILVKITHLGMKKDLILANLAYTNRERISLYILQPAHSCRYQ